MLNIATTFAAVVLIAMAAVWGTATFTGAQGEGHTPVVVCHWVPAHDGSFITIVVDDDGADGNKNVQAHAGHVNDVINPLGGVCPTAGGDPD